VLSRFADWIALPAGAKQRFFDEVDRHVGVANREIDMAQLATPLRIETLVVHDRQDREVPFTEAEAMHAALPASRLLATEGLGHGRILGDADVAQAVTSFLLHGAESRMPRAA
jgi:pimeloyl-ACP methyl ester carboxylesterase